MQKTGEGNYGGDYEGRGLAAAGRGSYEGANEYNEDGKPTGTTNSDYAARAASVNNQPQNGNY